MTKRFKGYWYAAATAAAFVCAPLSAGATEGEKPQNIEYPVYPPAPGEQPSADAVRKSDGCMSCHTEVDKPNMHENPAVVLGCVDCHGGDSGIVSRVEADADSADYAAARDSAHVQPLYPESWHYPHSANPEQSYTLLNRESPEFVRFVNPSDYRVVEEACGACHMSTIEAARRSLMATGAMFWGAAAYNNGILPFKNYILGEAYTRDGEAASITAGDTIDDALLKHGSLPKLYPLPAWETIKPADIFRVFERGGRNLGNLFPETGIPNPTGQLQRLEEPGRPDFRQSSRGPGTGARIAVPVLNIHKTRLNDPLMWFLGTNDQPGDYRSSGCAACHVVYANDRDPRHSGPYAAYGHEGQSATRDPTIPRDESGHPLQHRFSRSIPTSQCMTCHMHQPNMFMNSFLGYTMWDYESDAPFMWPEKQAYPSHEEAREILDRNPEGASIRGKWADPEFLKGVSSLNPDLNDTQFADYHGHGWNFRAVFKRDRHGNLLDSENRIVANSDGDKFQKAVLMSSIHVDKGMHCVDCHFAQDSHGNGHIYGEVAAAVEIACKDCHGSVSEYPVLRTSGPAAPPTGSDLSLLRNPDGRKRFEWRNGKLYQHSILNPDVEWELSLVRDSVTPGHEQFNSKAARAKLMSRDTASQVWGPDVPPAELAHRDEEIECYTCHTSWTTSCAGCHLPIEANWKTERLHYEGGETRNYATYNPQVSRDQMFMLGRRDSLKGGKIAPVRSSSALVLSSTNANRERIYVQQPPIAASGFSSQAFNPHFPHTVRKTETKTCTDCHLSAADDNNAIMAQLLLLGTNFVNFVGFNAWVGTTENITAVQVTEWEEPQAVIGSYLHRYAYPDWYARHVDNRSRLPTAHRHRSGPVGCLQLRGEYLYVAEGERGFRVYDVAGIANKGISQRIITAPFSPLGHDTHVVTPNATCLALPSNQPIYPPHNDGELMRIANQEQAFHPIYSYAVITDADEGLILVDVNTLADGDLTNNKLTRSLTFNPDGVLDGARHITLGGSLAYVMTEQGLVIVSLREPLAPRIIRTVPLDDGRASTLQFRYLFVSDRAGVRVIDVTHPEQAAPVTDSLIPLAAAGRLYVARTYLYVAAGSEGLAIIDVEQPRQPRLHQLFDAKGQLVDTRDVVVATTNASLFAYLADGDGGLKVIQLTSPASQPNFYGFSPEPEPQLIASYPTAEPATSLSKGLDRDRGVDETGSQMAVFGRLGSRPLNLEEMQRLYLDKEDRPWFVNEALSGAESSSVPEPERIQE